MPKETPSPRIDPEIVASSDMVAYAQVLRSFARGRSNVIETSSWTLSPYAHTDHGVECVYHPNGNETANFAYVVTEQNRQVLMENTHRRAYNKSGHSAFTDLEHMAAALAGEMGKPVRMLYPLYGQADTERFLLRRGYQGALHIPMGTLVPKPALVWTVSP